MKIVEYINGKNEATKTITSIVGLENHEIVLVERGDEIKKSLKKAYNVCGDKNMYSVKGIREALVEISIKNSKKSKSIENLCCVCGEKIAINNTMYCSDCSM